MVGASSTSFPKCAYFEFQTLHQAVRLDIFNTCRLLKSLQKRVEQDSTRAPLQRTNL